MVYVRVLPKKADLPSEKHLFGLLSSNMVEFQKKKEDMKPIYLQYKYVVFPSYETVLVVVSCCFCIYCVDVLGWIVSITPARSPLLALSREDSQPPSSLKPIVFMVARAAAMSGFSPSAFLSWSWVSILSLSYWVRLVFHRLAWSPLGREG